MNTPTLSPQTDTADKEMDSSVVALLISLPLILLTLGLVAFWPDWKYQILGGVDPAQTQVLGEVRSTSFLGEFNTRTQVEVGNAVLLVRGAVEINRGEVVERRPSALGDQLCVRGTNRCHEILSR